MLDKFSKREGYTGKPKEITIREDAPESIRVRVLNTIFKKLGYKDSRAFICDNLNKPTNPDNFSDEYIHNETEGLFYDCEWFRVYDIVESFYNKIKETEREKFEEEINDLFIEEGVAWQLINGKITVRGDEGFQQAVKFANSAASELKQSQRPTAASHIKNAIGALSAKPKANTAGAVSLATNALEAVLGDITDKGTTLGTYLQKNPELFNEQIQQALQKIYNYANNSGARHGKEGQVPTFEEAQFVVSIYSASCALLSAKKPSSKNNDIPFDDPPF